MRTMRPRGKQHEEPPEFDLLASLDHLAFAIELARIAARGPDPQMAYRYIAEGCADIRAVMHAMPGILPALRSVSAA